MLPLVSVDQRIELYCSADPSVVMPVPEEGKEADVSVRWLTLGEVATVDFGQALKVTVRPLNGTEQYVCTGGFTFMDPEKFEAGVQKALTLAVCAVTGPGVQALTPDEVQKWLPCLPLKYAEALGAKILNDSCGATDKAGKALGK